MELYKVEKIAEALYGCEECGEDGPHAEVTLRPIRLDTMTTEDQDLVTQPCRVELSEVYLAKTGIEEGKTVLFGADGRLRRYVKVVGAVIVKDRGVFATKAAMGNLKVAGSSREAK